MRWGTSLVFAIAGVLASVGTVAIVAPASYVDRLLQRATDGRVRVADTEGSFWTGRGRVVLVDAAQPTADGAPLAGLAVPGRVSWHLAALPLLTGRIDATLLVEGMDKPVSLIGGLDGLRGSDGALSLPSVELSRLGSPWNTIRPSGALSLRWEGFTIRRGLFDGRLAIELRDTASALSPVRPLGSYRIDVSGTGREAAVSITTLSGPLNLQGSGSWNGRNGLRFIAEARPDASERARLESFLALIGRREGEKTVIRIGA